MERFGKRLLQLVEQGLRMMGRRRGGNRSVMACGWPWRIGGLCPPRFDEPDGFRKPLVQHALMFQMRFENYTCECRGGARQQLIV